MSLKNILLSILLLGAFSDLLAFESAEHMFIGDAVQLKFPDGKSHSTLKLSNGLEVSYGAIVALGGDFFAILDSPISEGKTVADQKHCFLDVFATLAEDKCAPKTAQRYVAVFKNTLKAIAAGEKEGKRASEVFEELNDSLIKEYNVISGGGSFLTPLYPLGPAILQLISEANWDHFVPNSLIAYQAGHLAAIDEAIQAGKLKSLNKRLQGLQRAYAMNAFACHYLTDSFSAGHMRAPRKELNEHTKSACISALLVDFMHGEDCQEGLNVKNLNGDEWKAFGDTYYFESENAFSRIVLDQIMQFSADEIYFAFQSRLNPNGENISAEINQLLPQFSLLQDQGSRINTSPLFLWNHQEEVLLRREDINGLHDYAWIANWWGFSTLIDLGAYYRPLNSRQKALHEALYLH